MYTYIISCANVDFIKIGITANPQRRLTELQTNSPYALQIAFLIECSDLVVAQQLEKLLHELMHASRSNGEWFHAALSTATTFAQLILSVSGNIKLVTSIQPQPAESLPIRGAKADLVRQWFSDHPDDLNADVRSVAAKLKVGKDTVNIIRREFDSQPKPIDKARAWLAEHPDHGMPYRLAAATAGVSSSAMQRAMQKPANSYRQR